MRVSKLVGVAIFFLFPFHVNSTSLLEQILDSGLFDFSNPAAFLRSLADLFVGKQRLLCTIRVLGMLRSTDDPIFFTDKYRDDSVMTLSEAGNYIGAEAITEYVGFGREDSPFVQEGPIEQAELFRVVGLNSAGQCEFHRYSISAYTLDPSLTERDTTVSIALLNAIFLDFDESYLSRVNIYYPKPFLRWYFGEQFNTEAIRNFICSDVLRDACGIPFQGSCRATLDTIPFATGDAYVDGNSLGCRILHAAFAISNPEGHCAHVTLDPFDVDRLGGLRCSTSSRITPLDLFAAETIADWEEWVGVSILLGLSWSWQG